MQFPPYVHSVIASADPAQWPIQAQGINECGCTAPANALNILVQQPRFNKDDFVRQAGLFFQRQLGGTPSPITGWLIKKQGFGTHFGSLRRTNCETVLRDLIKRGIPAVIELGVNRSGPIEIYGQHSVVLVGYSDRYKDAAGQEREEYYFVDAQYPSDRTTFGLHTNDVDRDGDGVPEAYPGNRTIERDLFLRDYPTGIYFPIFPSQAAHDAWYRKHIRQQTAVPFLGGLIAGTITGTMDIWQPT
jgi:hypothetical protein